MFCLLTGNRSLGSQCEGGGGGDSEIELEGDKCVHASFWFRHDVDWEGGAFPKYSSSYNFQITYINYEL